MQIELYGDLFFEVSEAYSKAQKSAEAIPLLEALIASDQFSKAAVWLLYGKCLVACNRSEEAAEAYQKVSLALDPSFQINNFQKKKKAYIKKK